MVRAPALQAWNPDWLQTLVSLKKSESNMKEKIHISHCYQMWVEHSLKVWN
jgi:hypothetical protein